MKTIDMTPTWGEVGNIIWRLASSNEQEALAAVRSEYARAFAMAEAFSKVHATLTDEQKAQASKVLVDELSKQGY